jgi:peptide deformylase
MPVTPPESPALTLFPDPLLRKVCEPLPASAFDSRLRDFARKMFEIMYANKGVGLAAPQAGFAGRVFVVNTKGQEDPSGEQVLVNPEVVETAGSQTGSEGCLSLPGININVTRPSRVVMRAADLDGKVRELEGTELLARAYLHELDHLNGVLLVDKMGPLQRMTWKKKLRELEEEYEKKKRGK